MTMNDFDRTAREWLEFGPTTMPDRALQAALDEIHVTRQRRAWWPTRRASTMTSVIRIAAGVGAIALVTVVGLSFLPAGGIGGGPGPAPTPTASPIPTPAPIPFSDTSSGLSGPGRFVTADPFGARVTFTVPAGWTVAMGGPYLAGVTETTSGTTLDFSIFDKVYADPCHFEKGLLDPLPGPTVADLASALAKMPGVVVSPPTDVTVGGYSGKHLTMTAPASFTGCTTADGAFRIWELPLGATLDMKNGDVQQVWILDVDGTRLVIDTPQAPSQSEAEKAEVQAILDSITIAPAPTASASPSASNP